MHVIFVLTFCLFVFWLLLIKNFCFFFRIWSCVCKFDENKNLLKRSNLQDIGLTQNIQKTKLISQSCSINSTKITWAPLVFLNIDCWFYFFNVSWVLWRRRVSDILFFNVLFQNSSLRTINYFTLMFKWPRLTMCFKRWDLALFPLKHITLTHLHNYQSNQYLHTFQSKQDHTDVRSWFQS